MNIRPFSLLLIVIAIAGCAKKWQVSTVDTDQLRVEESQGQSDLDKLILPYHKAMIDSMSVVLGHCPKTLIKEPIECSLGNWMADAMYASAIRRNKVVDVSVMNYGGIRTSNVPKGDVTLGKIFEVMPFENRLVLMHLDFDAMTNLIDVIGNSRGWPISTGSQMTFEENKAIKVIIGGKALAPESTYGVVISDYLANGSGRCDFLKDLPRADLNLTVRDALIEQLTLNGEMKAHKEGRLIHIK